MVSASGVSEKSFSKSKFLTSDPHELCDRLNLLVQKKQAGNNSDTINGEIVGIADKI